MRLTMPAVLDGYQRRKDRTVSLRFVTQEKTSSDVMDIDSLTNAFGILYFRGEEQLNTDEIEELELEKDEAKREFDEPKTQSQRLRNVLFILWKQGGESGEFKTFYKQKTEDVIQHFKNKIEDE